jgi:hypothetical protein
MQITSLSYSKIASLLRCPQAFEYNYILKTPTALKGRMLCGRCYDHALNAAALRWQLFKEVMTAEEVADQFSDRWTRETEAKLVYDEEGEEKVEATIIDYGDDDPGRLKDAGIKLAKLYVATVLPKLEIASIQKRLEANIDGILFVGYPDLVCPDKVVDHKFRQKKMSERELENDLQATSYALLLGEPITFQFHQAIDTTEPRIEVGETTRGESDIEWFRGLAKDCWQVIQNGVFPPNPLSWTCSAESCAYWLDCRKSWF